jgi:toxin ParE1/3/4
MIKPVVRRAAADRDAQNAFRFYLEQADEAVALRFVDALESAIQAIQQRPHTGSPLQTDRPWLRGVRSRQLDRFPYLVFCLERDDHIEVWRVLHERRDIASRLDAADE